MCRENILFNATKSQAKEPTKKERKIEKAGEN